MKTDPRLSTDGAEHAKRQKRKYHERKTFRHIMSLQLRGGWEKEAKEEEE